LSFLSVLLLQLFTRKYCLEISGMRMRRVTWNWFPVKNVCWSFQLGRFV